MEKDIKSVVRAKYGAAAQRAAGGGTSSCGCSTPATANSCCSPKAGAPAASSCCGSTTTAQTCDCGMSSALYTDEQLAGLPAAAVAGSLGCGNPTALARLVPGEAVLDLGSGGGIDALLAARAVGPTGRVYGVDMTHEMLALARRNAERAGTTNVQFRLGEIEALPLPDASVDVIISNCVINLSTDKDAVFREAFRVLKPGGRFAVADTVFIGDLALIPAELRESLEGWGACISGSLERQDYVARLTAAGFHAAGMEITREHDLVAESGWEGWPQAVQLVSAFIHARKPDTGATALRPAGDADLPFAQRLLAEAALPGDGLTDQFPTQYAVATVGSRPVALAGIERYGSVGLLRSVAVDELWRGHGLGDQLVADRLAGARAAGLTDVYLLTTTATPFFVRLGFAALPREAAPAELRKAPEFASVCPGTSTFMRLHLS